MSEKMPEGEPNENSQNKAKEGAPPSPQKAMFSLVGLIVIAAAVFYGLPHVSKALEQVSAMENEEASEKVESNGEESQQEESKVDKRQEKKTTVPEPEAQPTENTTSSINHTELQYKVAEALEKALRKPYREGKRFFIKEEAQHATNKREVKAFFEIDETLYELTFTYNPEYKAYVAKLDNDELVSFFSLAPRFQLND